MSRAREDKEWIRLGSVAEIPEEEIRSYELGEARVAVANLDGRLYAFEDECTHQDCLLSEGSVTEEETVVCPEDGSVFDMNTGEPTAGPAEEPIRVFAIRVQMDWVEVDIR